MTTFLNPDEWHRASAGRRQSFSRVEATSIGALLSDLPDQFTPYRLIAHRLVKGRAGYHSDSAVVEPDEVHSLVAAGVWQYFIVSELLSPQLLERLPDVDTRTFAVNGAVNLQIGRRDPSGGFEAASIGVVDRVATPDGEIRDHRDYRSVFDAAVRVARNIC